jgi:hypothetical protein
MTEITTEEVARRVAEKIEKYGWVQGWAGNEENGFCLYGAFLAAYEESGETYCAEEAWNMFWKNMQRQVRTAPGEHSADAAYREPWHYNDEPGRSAEDVLLMIKKAGAGEPGS